MKFTIKRTTFNELLNQNKKLVNGRSSIPVLTGIKMDIENGILKLTTSNVDTTLTLSTDKAENTEDGSGIVDMTLLSRLISGAISDEITLNFDKDKTVCQVIDGENTYNLDAMDPTLYPRLPENDNTKQIKLSSMELHDLVDATVPFVSTDDTRPQCTGVHFIFKDKKATAQATDSHRLAQKEISFDHDIADADFILNPSDIKLVMSLAGENSDITIQFGDGSQNILFMMPNAQMFVRRIIGQYVDFSRIIPNFDAQKNRLVFDKAKLFADIKQLSILDTWIDMQFTKDSNEVVFKAQGNKKVLGKFTCKLESDLPAVYDMTVSLNPEYLLSILKVIKTDKTMISTSDRNLFPLNVWAYEVDNDEKNGKRDESMVHVVTPIRTRY